MEIALSAVTNAGRSRMAAVTAEVGAHVVLLVTQQVVSSPFHVTADSVLLSDAGDVRLLPLSPASAHEAELELRQLLAELLALAPAAPPALKAAAERGSGGGLEALEAELHAALIPINHAAARRALARLFRETRRASGGAGASLDVTPTVGAEVTPLPRARTTTPTPASAVGEPSDEVRASLDVHAAEPVQGDLDIDVDVDDDEPPTALTMNATTSNGVDVAVSSDPPPARLGDVMLTALDEPSSLSLASVAPGIDGDDGVPLDVAQASLEQHVAHRSDVGELLASFLVHTRSEERMSEALRLMVGVERGSSHGPCLVNGVLSPDARFRR